MLAHRRKGSVDNYSVEMYVNHVLLIQKYCVLNNTLDILIDHGLIS